MEDKVDALSQFFYKFTVPEADFPVYYKANGEIGIGVTLTVDVEKMCAESGTFKNAYDKANPTYQTVFYQWYKNGEAIKDATNPSYTVKSADKNSSIHCKVTLVDGKYGIGEQFVIRNVITVLNVNIPYPKDGETRIMSGISADGAVLSNIMWIHKDTENTMQSDHQYVEGDVYEYLVVFEVKDGFNFDYQGATTADMTLAYIYGEKLENAGSGAGLMYYYGEVTAIHKHQYSDSVWSSEEDGHWHPCIIPGCPDPNEDWEGYVFHHGSEATCQTKGKCSACGYEYYGEHDVAVPEYFYLDDMKCVDYCATEGCDYVSDWNYHTGGVSDCQHKSVCEICRHEYGKLGEHVAKAEWKTDENNHWHECKYCGGEELEKAAHADTNNDEKCDACSYAMPKAEENDPSAPTPDVPNTNTDKPTDATDKPSDETESEKDDSTETEAPTDKGCGGCTSSAALSALAIVAVVGSALVIKKKED
jgi:hypothetical protein